MRRPDYVLDVVRAMYDWAADPQRGKLHPGRDFTIRSSAGGGTRQPPLVVAIGEPDITVDMAVDFLRSL